jgi:hypothetical protein
MSYYDESYPPSILNYSNRANAGAPGAWVPAGSTPPESVQALASGHWVTVVASPATPWTAGQYVQTGTPGAAGRASWSGTDWVGGAAPLLAPDPPETTGEKPFIARPIQRDELPPDTTVQESTD